MKKAVDTKCPRVHDVVHMSGWTKLFNSILASTIWNEPNHVRILWITLLAMSDKAGNVNASIPGLATLSRLTVDEVKAALEVLKSPDPYSRTKDHEGRRIKDADGGWFIINYAKYRNEMDADSRREYKRIKQRGYRKEHRQSVDNLSTRGMCGHIPSVSASASEGIREGECKGETGKGVDGELPLGEKPKEKKPLELHTLEEVKLEAQKQELPESEAAELHRHYMSNGWMVGKNRMKSLPHAMAGWKTRWEQRRFNGPAGGGLSPQATVFALQGHLKDLKEQEKQLMADTSELWQQRANPAKVKELEELRVAITETRGKINERGV